MARRTKEDADATRSRLLDAAEGVFLEKGVSRASLNDIAAAAGATRGAIYWHFKDKLDLFNAVMDRVREPFEQDFLVTDTLAQVPPLQRLRARIGAIFAALETDAHLRRVLEIAMFRVEYTAELSGVREHHLQSLERLRERLVRDLRQAAQADGLTLPMSVDAAAMGLQALFDGLMQAWILSDGGFSLRLDGGANIDTYLRGLGFAL